jgi:cardiolipin synthase
VSPLAWLSRDHRKSLVVDGEVGFVSGLCVGDKWTGDPAHGIQPWRDTGIELRGPAVADLVRAFARVWAAAGRPLPRETAHPRRLADAGTAAVRVIATEPNTTALYRLDQLIAATARRTLWLCDAYFAATPVYMQALRAAAADGVDVRLLVPGASDIPIMRNLARTAYRPLLEAGVRVFEWNGPMMHAKTAVADGRWARVGSSNLNIASWLGNWELDVAVEDEAFAEEMEASFDRDLAEATEIVLRAGLRARPRWGAAGVGDTPAARQRGRGQRSLASARTGVASVGGAIGAAVADRRPLGGVEQPIVLGGGLALLVLAALLLWFPRIAALPIALLAAWFGVGLVARAWHMRRRPRKRAASSAD